MRSETEEAVASENKKAGREAPVTRGDRIWREIVSWFWVIVAFLFIEGTLVQARVIPSGSMENTVLIGDHLIVSRIGYDAGIPFTSWHVPLWREPKRQQIIVFSAPLPGSPDFIKRVIGVPGDHIKIMGTRVLVNGTALEEPYALHDPSNLDSSGESFPPTDADSMYRLTSAWAVDLPKHVVNGELVVPQGEYFMMGDNRENSYDSRFWGFVPRDDIIGTPVIIYMSIDAPEEVWGPGHIADRFATYLNAAIHPREVRWRRLFLMF